MSTLTDARRSGQGRQLRTFTCLLLLMACCTKPVQAAVQLSPDSYLKYVPNLGGNVAIGVIYSILCLALFYHTFFTGIKVDKWALCLPIGAFFEALGFWLRVPMRTQQSNEPLYTVMYLFVVLAPAAFLAFNYILFGRLCAALEGGRPNTTSRKHSPYSFIPPRWVKRIFVTSDVCTFIVQAAGGGMQTSNDYNTALMGNHVFLGGVSAQGASYLLFTALIVVAHIRVYRRNAKNDETSPFNRQVNMWNFHEPIVLLFATIYISSIGILVRSVYRIIEMSQGYNGYLYTHEIFTFLLDALPLVIAIGVWALIWPCLLIRRIRDEVANTRHQHNTNDIDKDEEINNQTGQSTPAHDTVAVKENN